LLCRYHETPGRDRIKRVFLDGKLIERVVAFDSDSGWVEHWKLHYPEKRKEPSREFLFGSEVSWDEIDGESEPACQSASPATPA